MEFLTQIHWDAVFKIIGIDVLLGGDNAVVIAMACAAIPAAQRSKAVLGGTIAAIVLRVLVLAGAAWLIEIPYLKILCGFLLFWIGFKLIAGEDGDKPIAAKDKVWEAIKTIAMADLVMSIDNVFAVTGASQSAGHESLGYAIAGILFSIPFIVFGATVISRFMDRFPIIIWAGAALLGWVGAEMIVSDPGFTTAIGHDIVKALGVAIVILPAFLFGKLKSNKEVVQNV